MGAWGSGSFDNDDALDRVTDLVQAVDFDVVRDALSSILEQAEEYLEAPECSAALAAAEVVAALRGKPAAKLPEGVVAWLKAHASAPEKSLVIPAAQAVRKIGGKSGLKELWDEGGGEDAAAWSAGVQDLLKRLS